MISRLSLEGSRYLFIHSMQGTSRSFPTYRGMLLSISKFVTLYLACLCIIGVLPHVNIHAITTRRVSLFSLSNPSGGGSLCYVCPSQGTFYTAVLQTGPPTLGVDFIIRVLFKCRNNLFFPAFWRRP